MLKLYSTRYNRGAVIKLARNLSSTPAAKFIVQRHEGRFELKRGLDKPELVGTFDTEAAAIEVAERECERIRSYLGGADGIE